MLTVVMGFPVKKTKGYSLPLTSLNPNQSLPATITSWQPLSSAAFNHLNTAAIPTSSLRSFTVRSLLHGEKTMSKKIALSSNTSNLPLTSLAAEIVASNVDLLTEILVRVPAKSLVKFKSVSKQWLSLISDSQFSHNHTTHQNPPPLPSAVYFFSKLDHSLSLNDQITHVSVNGSPQTSFPNLSFLDALGSKTNLLHSSNGLMLCSTGDKSKDYVVCNLTTQKFVVLPTLAVVSKAYCKIKSYLVFDPKKSRYYEVAVVILAVDSNTTQLAVYSSESGSWKTTTLCPSIHFPLTEHGVLWNGAIILMSWAEHVHSYYRIDIDVEKLTATRIPLQDTNLSKEIIYFGECGGHLLLIQIPSCNATEFRVLEMMDGENTFRRTVKYVVDIPPSILPKREGCVFKVISVMKVGANQSDLAVVLYSQESPTI